MKKIIQYFLSAMIALIFSTTAVSAISLTPSTAHVLGSTDGLGVAHSNALVDTEGGNDNGPYGLNTPGGMDIDPIGHRLFVADEVNDRVLVFQLDNNNNIASRKAIAVLGQADFDHTSSNREGSVNAATMNDPAGVDFYDDGSEQWLLVADQVNDRVLIYNITAGISNGMAAVKVLGQTSFTSSSSSRSQSRVKLPRSVRVLEFGTRRLLFVADESNDRTMIWDVSAGMGAIVSSSNADFVLGQPNFTTNGTSTSATTNDGSIGFAQWGNVLFVSETFDHRISGFDLGVNAANLVSGMAATYLLGQAVFSGRTADRGGRANAGTLDNPGFLAVSGDKLMAVDSDNRRVLVYDLNQFTQLGVLANGMNAEYVFGQNSFTASASSATSQSSMSGPWGLAIAGNTLFVSDQFNDRITTFDLSTLDTDIANASFAPNAIDALGQTTNFPGKADGSETVVWDAKGSNDTGPVGMQDPDDSTIAVVGGVSYLFMTDSINNRVLAFEASDNGTPIDLKADFVLGQPNFDVDTPSTSATIMDDPRGIIFDVSTSSLFVSDTDNDRVLMFDLSSGMSNGMAASAVLGQAVFTTGGSGRTQIRLRQPRKLALGTVAGTRYLFVADKSNDRIMLFNISDGVTTGELAAHVLGAPNFTQNFSGAAQNKLSNPEGVDFDQASQRLFVADGTADRVLVWDLSAGIVDGMNASFLLGQSSWTATSSGLSASEFRDAYDVDYDSARDILWVVDLGNNRITGFDLSAGITNNMNATYVIGQPNFTSGSWQKGTNRTAYTVGAPSGIAIGSDGNLIITQWDDDRAVVFGGSFLAPQVNIGVDTTINEGGLFSRTASFSDGDPADSWNATVDYGDGTSGTLTLNDDKSFDLNHVYNDNGVYTVTVTVQDSAAATATDSFVVTVNNVAPTVNVGANGNIDTGAILEPSGTFSDPGVSDTHTATVDYGDGSGSQSLFLSGSSFILNHAFATAGTFTVSVTVTDNNGGSGSDSLLVTVVDIVNPDFDPEPSGDTEAPVILNVPADVALIARTRGGYIRLPRVLRATDNVDGSILATTDHRSSIYPVGTTVVTYTATDSSGNTATAIVNVTVTEVVVGDTEAPVIQGVPADVTLIARPRGGYVRLPRMLNATDNVDGTVVANTSHRSSIYPLGITVVTYTATDSSGNTATATVNVTVIDPNNVVPAPPAPTPLPIGGDTEAPVIQGVPADVTVTARPRGGYVRLPRLLQATDNVDGIIPARTSHRSSIYPVGTTVVTYTATDSSGNKATATVIVTVTQ